MGSATTPGPSLFGMSEYLSYVGGVHGVVAAAGAAAALGLTYMFGRSSNPIEPMVSLDNQSRLLTGLERIRTSRLCPDGKHIEYLYEDCRTLFDVMYRGARVSNNGPCMGWRDPGSGEYKWIHYNQVLERIKCIACGLVKLGEKPGQQTFIGLYTQNCVEWIVTEQACYYFSMIIVPLYDTLGAAACAFIINQGMPQIKIILSSASLLSGKVALFTVICGTLLAWFSAVIFYLCAQAIIVLINCDFRSMLSSDAAKC